MALVASGPEAKLAAPPDPRVQRAMRWAEQRVSEGAPVDLAAMAAAAGLSDFHFHRAFRRSVGEPAVAWVRRIRLERAATLVAHSAWPLVRVGLASGYASQAAFTRAFTRHFGLSPARFRQRSGQVAWLAEPGERRPVPDGAVPVVTLPERRLVCVRHVGTLATLGPSAAPLVGLPDAERSDRVVLVFHDDEAAMVDPTRARIDAGVVAPDGAPAPDGFDEVVLGGGDHAVATLAGTLDEVMHEAERFLYQRIPESGLQPRAIETIVELDWATLERIVTGSAWAEAPVAMRVLHPVGDTAALLPSY